MQDWAAGDGELQPKEASANPLKNSGAEQPLRAVVSWGQMAMLLNLCVISQ